MKVLNAVCNEKFHLKSHCILQVVHSTIVAREMRAHMQTDWCIAEGGATGPTFIPPDCKVGFTAVAICGPDVETTVLVASDHNDRELNMWQFTQSALDVLHGCLKEFQGRNTYP